MDVHKFKDLNLFPSKSNIHDYIMTHFCKTGSHASRANSQNKTRETEIFLLSGKLHGDIHDQQWFALPSENGPPDKLIGFD